MTKGGAQGGRDSYTDFALGEGQITRDLAPGGGKSRGDGAKSLGHRCSDDEPTHKLVMLDYVV